ncbi:hypothetical protein KPH14_009087 [Odynerus spinipes]|uniref:Death ligand signal enhancer n=1 Tax=Odynerus spinipes TaxID=1348599 RepID=A0AAD9RNM3_9HYME|nr:hypothetical protein KPH14_009087 [Odynerus spinipes]
MWKFVTRGIRESLERRACRTNIYSQTSAENNTKNEIKTSLVCNHKFIAPTFSAYNNGFCGSKKSDGAEDKNEDTKWNTKHNWTEAVGWSGVLAVGWVVCQSLCLRRRWFNKDQHDLSNLEVSQLSQARIPHLITELLNLQPKSILPVTNCIGGTKKYLSKENTTNETETEQRFHKTFGPITVEEALNEAADEFNNIHKLVMGEFELQFGLKALDEKRYKDAMRHFAAGAKFSSPESMFNLGLCYELGLGTLADYTKAANYYDRAAKQGHADAMYNLGVFHAQGKGGLVLDLNRARSYFAKAAQLGQTQAQQALDLENSAKQSLNTDDTSVSSDNYTYLSKADNLDHEMTTKKLLTKLIGYTNTYNKQSHAESNLKSSECSQRIGETKNPTDLFLDYLGLLEPNTIPVTINLDDCKVQC